MSDVKNDLVAVLKDNRYVSLFLFNLRMSVTKRTFLDSLQASGNERVLSKGRGGFYEASWKKRLCSLAYVGPPMNSRVNLHGSPQNGQAWIILSALRLFMGRGLSAEFVRYYYVM